MAAIVNFLSDETYKDPTLNPAGRVPDRFLKILFQNNVVHPIGVAQMLAGVGCVTVNQFAIQLTITPVPCPRPRGAGATSTALRARTRS